MQFVLFGAVINIMFGNDLFSSYSERIPLCRWAMSTRTLHFGKRKLWYNDRYSMTVEIHHNALSSQSSHIRALKSIRDSFLNSILLGSHEQERGWCFFKLRQTWKFSQRDRKSRNDFLSTVTSFRIDSYVRLANRNISNESHNVPYLNTFCSSHVTMYSILTVLPVQLLHQQQNIFAYFNPRSSRFKSVEISASSCDTQSFRSCKSSVLSSRIIGCQVPFQKNSILQISVIFKFSSLKQSEKISSRQATGTFRRYVLNKHDF